jgi:hypothetical protein
MAVVKREPGGTKKKKRRDEDEDDTPKEKFVLSTEITEPSDRLEDYIILLTGEKKIGKTTLASEFNSDKSYFLATEVGYRGLRIRKSDITDWRTAKAAARALKKAGKKYGPIIVDTVDKLYALCESYICEKLMINNLSDEEWGKGYAACRKEFDAFITLLSQIGVGLILITHTEEREVKRRGGGTYDRIVPTMSNQARKVIEPLVDIWCYYMYDEERRVLVIQGDDHISAGHRLVERFRTPAGKPVRQIDMGRSAKRGFKNLLAAFNNQYEPPREDREEEDEPKKKSFKIKR